MTETAIFEETLKTLADRILRVVPQDGEITSWEIRNKLHISSSMLYLALGRLAAENKVRIIPEQLNYRIVLFPKPQNQ
ncbi:MAG: hypothetical protein PHP45_11295 [Elusimicrobiales bacterium]|nr:hypothetical protein [Elusimicrobiales bacterium]